MTIDRQRILEDQAYKDELRWRCQTDLLFLGREILGYDKLDERDHRELADMFVKKDPRKAIEQQDNEKKTRLIIIPRRTYKTTMNIVDTVQWIIGFPEVAIMVMTAANSPDSPLADAFVDEVGSHFSHKPDSIPTLLECLFPECSLPQTRTGSFKGEFTIPTRTRYRRDPTLKGVSIEQSLSGWHPDIIKSEDVQDNRNSQTPFGLKKVRQNFYINQKMLAEWGFTDITGTRYGPADLYGHMIQTAGERFKVLWRPAYIRKPHAMKMDEWELAESDVTLQFPHNLPWNFLQEKKKEDESSWWTQYMNIAEGGFRPTFPIDKLEASKVHEDTVPFGTVHYAWRFEYGENKNQAAAVGVEHAGRMYVVDIWRKVLSPSALARQVVSMARKWESHRVMIEDTPGARSMEPHIFNEALESEWRLEISWTPFIQDDTARTLAIKSAEPHLLAGRLLFSDGIHDIDDWFRALYHYGMVDEDDIPNVVSRVAACLPPTVAAGNFADEDEWEQLGARDAYERTYGRGRYAEAELPVVVEEEEYAPSFDLVGLEEMMPGLSG